MATAQGIRAGRAYVELGADSSKLKREIRRAKGFFNDLAATARSKLELGAAIAAPVALAVKTFASFDDQMRLVQGVTGATGEAFEKLTATAKQLGATTSWTAAQVAEGMTSLGRAGFQSEEIDASIKGVMDLARATGTEIGPATDIASNALRSFGLQASEMGRVCDVLTATANGSAQTLEDLGEAFKYVAPIAASTGGTLEDTAKIVGALANFGVKGSQAGTVFKAIQTRMATDKKAQKVYAELGIDTKDAEGNLRKVNDVLVELGEKIKNMPTAERLEKIKALFGQYGMTGVSITAANFRELNDAIDRASGTAARVAETMDAGIGGALRVTKSAVEGLALSVGNSLVPYLSELATKIQGATAWLTKFNGAHPGVIASVAKFGASLVAVQGALWLVSKTAVVLIDKISLAGRVLSTAWKAGQSAMAGCQKLASMMAGVQKANQAALAAQVAYDTKLIGVAQAKIALNTAKTASEKAVASANYASAQSELAEAQATLANANAKKASAAASAKALGSTLALAGGIAVVTALAYAFVKWGTAAERAAERAREATDAQERLSQENASRREEDRQLLDELIAMENQQSLTNAQMARAQYIIKELTDRYGDLGIKIDSVAQKLRGASAAQAEFNEEAKQQEIQNIKDEIATMEAEVERKMASIKNRDSFFGGFASAIGSGFSSEKMLAARQEEVDRIAELERKIRSAKHKLELARNERDAGNFAPVQAPGQFQQQQSFAPVRAPAAPEKTPEKNEAFSSEKTEGVVDDFLSEIAEKSKDFLKIELPETPKVEIPEIDLTGSDVEIPEVTIPELQLPEVDAYGIQSAADSLAEQASKVEGRGSFDAFEVAQNWQRDELRKQTNAMASQLNESKRTNRLLENYLTRDEEYI